MMTTTIDARDEDHVSVTYRIGSAKPRTIEIKSARIEFQQGVVQTGEEDGWAINETVGPVSIWLTGVVK